MQLCMTLMDNGHDITGIHDINGNFPYDDIFRKNHARLYT